LRKKVLSSKLYRDSSALVWGRSSLKGTKVRLVRYFDDSVPVWGVAEKKRKEREERKRERMKGKEETKRNERNEREKVTVKLLRVHHRYRHSTNPPPQ
jgi:hypothetical protein